MNATTYIGKRIVVTIDRPLGSAHPQHGFRYPVNYGFVPETISGDGEELDAYVLGVAKPVEEFEGECVAVVRRKQEDDDKLVIVPIGLRMSEKQIRRAINFQERFFKSDILFDG